MFNVMLPVISGAIVDFSMGSEVEKPVRYINSCYHICRDVEY